MVAFCALSAPPVCPIQGEKPWPALLLLRSCKAMPELYFLSPVVETSLVPPVPWNLAGSRTVWLSESFPSASLCPLEKGHTAPSGDFYLFLELFPPGLTILLLHLSGTLVLEILHQAHLILPQEVICLQMLMAPALSTASAESKFLP